MDIGITYKFSKLEWDMLGTGKTRDELIEEYGRLGQDVEGIIQSHERQKMCRERLLDELPQARYIDLPALKRGDVTGNIQKRYDKIFTIGGDNFSQQVAFYFPDSEFVLINSDPETSHGALLHYDCDSVLEDLDRIVKGDYGIIERTKLATTVNGKRINDTTCTFSLKNTIGDMMTRYMLKIGDESEHQKSSGLLVVTGSGSGDGAWYRNEGLYLPQINSGLYPLVTQEFQNTSREIRTLTLGHMFGADCEYKWLNKAVGEGDMLGVYYWSHEPAQISVDSVERYNIKEGSILTFRVSENKLRVVRPLPYNDLPNPNV